jgi:hypothetical protein
LAKIVSGSAGPSVPKYYTGLGCKACPYGSYKWTDIDGNGNQRWTDYCYTLGEVGGELLNNMNGSNCHGKGINSDKIPYSEDTTISFWSY